MIVLISVLAAACVAGLVTLAAAAHTWRSLTLESELAETPWDEHVEDALDITSNDDWVEWEQEVTS